MVGDELEAAHQFVSPAKYLAADRRISRSVASLAFSARSALFSARSRASSCSGVSTPGTGRGRRGGPAVPDRHASGLAPRRQRRLTDTELASDHGDRRALGVPVQRDRIPLELIRVILPRHRVGSSRFPRQTSRDWRVQHLGSSPMS